MDQACVSQLKGQCWPFSLVSSGSPFQGDLEERDAVSRDGIEHGSRGADQTGRRPGDPAFLYRKRARRRFGFCQETGHPRERGGRVWNDATLSVPSLGSETFRYKGTPLGTEHTGGTTIPSNTSKRRPRSLWPNFLSFGGSS